MAVDPKNGARAKTFVEKTLGPLSSHPDMMVRQKRVLWWVGMTPFFVCWGVVLWILAHYRLSDFAAVHDWQTFLAACAAWWGKIKWSALVLALLGCVSLGFTAMLNLLWMVGVTLGKKDLNVSERDNLPFPAMLVGLGALCWLVPVATWAMKGVFSAVDWRLNVAVQLLSNFLCLFPLAVLLVWTKWARRFRDPGPDEVVRHPVSHLLAALLLFAAGVVVFVSQKPDFFDWIIAKWFPWLAQCGVDADRAYGWVRLVLAACLGLGGVFHAIVWRLRTEIRPRKKSRGNAETDGTAETDASRKKSGNEIPEGARLLLANLPGNIRAEAMGEDGALVCRKKVREQSPYLPKGGEAHGLGYLMGGDKVPTKDQVGFFARFVESYEAARRQFGERTDFKERTPQDGAERADILLLGEDGAGRTEILLAAALYAAVVRGQRVLFLCADAGGVDKLVERTRQRLEWLGVDVYVSVGKLDRGALDQWIDPVGGSMPPDLLFSTPETAEDLFFANPLTRKRESAAEMRMLLTGFGALFVDDFLEMPPSFRAHTAFLLDKMKLLQAAEPVLAQYVVAATPLQKPDGVEAIGNRLFGMAGFDRKRNVLELKPRPHGEYWFGTLRVARGGVGEGDDGKSLENAAKELVRISAAKGYQALLYQKGMSSDAKTQFIDECGGGKGGGGVQVASKYRELEELEETPDNVFYLSLVCGDAGTALRLNLVGGDPVFFRIAMEGEGEPEPPAQYGLIPDETALSLRIHHLRNVLQFVEDHVPVPDEAWERFQITMNHPCIRALKPGATPGTVAVSWLHDEMADDGAYGANALWPYLVLETPVAYGAGMEIDFNLLPSDRGSIWKDMGRVGKILLAEDDGSDGDRGRGHLAVWRFGAQTLGESDLSHADELVYVGMDEYTVEDALQPGVEDAKRYAVLFRGQYRHGGDTEAIHPIRNLSWRVPPGELKVPSVQVLDEIASFQVERLSSATCRVAGTLSGRIDLRGKPTRNDPLDYCYDAYMSCLVLLPTFARTGAGGSTMEMQARTCLDGAWATDPACGFSSTLTHAFAAALRRKIADWPFFAFAPVFFTEGREESVGRATIWIVEPANSGRTVQPRLLRLMKENPDFRIELYTEAKNVLEACSSLEELRLASRLAFTREADPLDEDDKQNALQLLELLLDRERSAEWVDRTRKEREERREKRKAEGRRKRTAEPSPEEREFDRVLTGALLQFSRSIDVSKFAVEYGWDADRLCDQFDDVLWNNPEIFWVARRCRYHWWSDHDGKITRFVFTDLDYAFGPEQRAGKQDELERVVQEALKETGAAADDAEKALILHDFIVRTCDYDMDAKNRHDQSPLARTAYSVLVRHRAVCEGYTMAYRLLLKRVGIESEEVLSEAMNHCWNYVRLGDSWFHADVTWDDPVFSGPRPEDTPVCRENFLMSDAQALKTEHRDWNVRGLPAATDTTYDGRDWSNPKSGSQKHGRGSEGEDGRTDGNNGKSVPWKAYKDHPLFRAKDKGNVRQCRGKIHLRVFFVDDGDSAWTDAARATYRETVKKVARRLESEGRKAGVEIAVSWSDDNRTMSHVVQKGCDINDWVPGIMGLAGEKAVAAEQNQFKRKQGCDEVPMVFVFNKDVRGAAHASHSSSPRVRGEWALVGTKGSFAKNKEGVLLHEILHLLGAADFYYPPDVEAAAEQWLPGSIMADGDAIDDLTRVLIGWNDCLSANAVAFLDAVRKVTAKEIDDACDAEWENGNKEKRKKK